MLLLRQAAGRLGTLPTSLAGHSTRAAVATVVRFIVRVRIGEFLPTPQGPAAHQILIFLLSRVASAQHPVLVSLYPGLRDSMQKSSALLAEGGREKKRTWRRRTCSALTISRRLGSGLSAAAWALASFGSITSLTFCQPLAGGCWIPADITRGRIASFLVCMPCLRLCRSIVFSEGLRQRRMRERRKRGVREQTLTKFMSTGCRALETKYRTANKCRG